jgi:hypothetical protein
LTKQIAKACRRSCHLKFLIPAIAHRTSHSQEHLSSHPAACGPKTRTHYQSSGGYFSRFQLLGATSGHPSVSLTSIFSLGSTPLENRCLPMSGSLVRFCADQCSTLCDQKRIHSLGTIWNNYACCTCFASAFIIVCDNCLHSTAKTIGISKRQIRYWKLL